MSIVFYIVLSFVAAITLGWVFGTFLAPTLLTLMTIAIVPGLAYLWWKETRPTPHYRGSGVIGGVITGLFFTLCIVLGLVVMWVTALQDMDAAEHASGFWDTIRPYLLK